MIGGNDEAPQPEVDAQSNSRQRQPGESAYRYYRRRIGGWFRQITHEQHLAYGTWALAVGTWGLFLLPGSAGQFFPSRSRRVEVYNIISFGFEPWRGMGMAGPTREEPRIRADLRIFRSGRYCQALPHFPEGAIKPRAEDRGLQRENPRHP